MFFHEKKYYDDDLIPYYEGGSKSTDRIKNKYGDDADKYSSKDDMPDGFVEKRGCTDPFCLLIFLAFIGSIGYLTFYANINGDPLKLIAPIDGDNRLCGWSVDGKTKDDDSTMSKLFITDLSDGLDLKAIFKSAVCVDKCPKATGKGEGVFKCRPTCHNTNSCC